MPTSLPPDAPVLVLATPGPTEGVAEEIAAVVRVDNPQIEVLLTSVSDLADSLPSGRDAVIVPLLTWDDPVVLAEIGKAVAAAGSGAAVTPALGPHPLLAEALHIRLAERGLARADRVRLLNVSSPVDAVILGTVGGDRAVHAVQATAVLLASRLTLPVVAAALDAEPGVAVAAQRLRAAGAERLAIAPCMIGHEAPRSLVEQAAAAINAGHAEPLGSHSAVAELVARAYGSQLAS
ncbi:sirohydrochlorin chelatase [Nonomuraea sp. NPDC049309]|uniref:sirohydrochlorin chelatase n=1 Tax=Nonomuraea sp. NPDC049309 TaxID=3364350 RepID=UPI003714E84E